MARTTLGEICTKIGSGATPRGGKAAYCEEGISLIRSQNVLDYAFLQEGLVHISSEQAEKLKNVVVEREDVLLNITGDSVARACMVDPIYLPARVNQHVCIIRADSRKAIGSYVLYFLQMNKAYLLQLAAGGATRNALTKEMITNLEIELPPIDEQRRIVSLLDDIQQKIKENNEINKNLAEQMNALYRSWFIEYAISGGNKPDNWKQSDIYSIASIIYGAPFSSKLFNTEGLGTPIIRIRDLKEQAFVTYTTEVHPKGHLIKPGDIVVGMDGEFRPYIWGNREAWLNQRVCIFESKVPTDKAFLLYTLKPLLNMIEQTQVGTTVIHVGKKDFDSFKITLPDRETLDEFGTITTPMIEQIVSHCLENKRLAELRDSLLPRLMSGELDVSDIDL